MRRKAKIAIVAAACGAVLLVGALVFWMPLHKLPRHYPSSLDTLGSGTERYREQTGDYPHTAAELVEKVGPIMREAYGYKLSLIGPDRILVEGRHRPIEVQYRYVSPDERPQYEWKERWFGW